MIELSTLLDRVWLSQWALASLALFALAICALARARPATRASLATILAASTLLPWILPVIAEPGQALQAARVDFAFTTIGGASSSVPADSSSLLRIPDLIWLGGSALALAWLALGFVRGRQWLGTMSPAGSEIQASVRVLAHELGVDMPRVLVTDVPCSPAVYFLPRAMLVLPAKLWRDLPANTRESLLLHELAHLRRRDHWLRAIVGASCIVGWWNPVVWLLRTIVRSNSEEATDAWVAEFRPQSREAYANGLLATQRHLLNHGARTARVALSALSPSARLMTRRIQRLFGKARPRSTFVGSVLLLAVFCASCCASWLTVQVSAAPNMPAQYPNRGTLRVNEVIGRLLIKLEGETKPELLSEYISQLESANSPQERRRAADDLGNLFELGTPAVPALLHAMANDDSISVRREAIDAIGRIGSHVADDVMPQLLKTLAEDPSPRVRRQVEDVLERFRDSRR